MDADNTWNYKMKY